MSLEGLNRLKVWVKAKEFAVAIYKKVLPLLPTEEKWNLNQQLRRSAISVPANIAEGYGRFYYQDNVRFCYNARGSLEEILSHLTVAHELNYISEVLYRELMKDVDEVDRMLNGYIAYLKKSKQGANERSTQTKSLLPRQATLVKISRNLKTLFSNPLFSTFSKYGANYETTNFLVKRLHRP